MSDRLNLGSGERRNNPKSGTPDCTFKKILQFLARNCTFKKIVLSNGLDYKLMAIVGLLVFLFISPCQIN